MVSQRKRLDNVKYTKYTSTAGLATKSWGPSGWMFLFACIMGGYPVKIDPGNKDHIRIRKHFQNMFTGLAFTMPCIFCRESYKTFIKQLPIEPFLTGRIKLMHWLYQIRDRVNQKLIRQEMECYNNEKKRLKRVFHSQPDTPTARRSYYKQLQEFKKRTMITQPSPPFESVLDRFESIRAVCSNRAKTCALKQSKK